jgi:hypothetical protein
MPGGISAYLTVYNDFDILPHTLRAIAPYIDELVVVDGAYEWMVPYLETIGADLGRSNETVYDVLETSGINYRVLARTWRDEPEKRMAGYDACSGRYVFRIDADEVPFFDDVELERFVSSGGAVAQMPKATYIEPQWLVALDESGLLPSEPFLFDRTRVEPDIHLNYLWLVLGPDRLPSANQKPHPISEAAIGFNAHLNEWRTLEGQIRRAAFYWLHSMRQHGVPWIPHLRGKPLRDIKSLFEVTPPEIFQELIASAIIRRSQTFRVLGWYSVRSPLMRQKETLFVDRFAAMRSGRAELNRKMVSDGLTFCSGMPIGLDLSSRDCLDILAGNGEIRLATTCPLARVSATLHQLLPGSPWHSCTDLACEHEGSQAIIRLPAEPPPYTCLRRELDITLSGSADAMVPRFRVIR